MLTNDYRAQYLFDNPLSDLDYLFGDIDVDQCFEEQEVDQWLNTHESDQAHVDNQVHKGSLAFKTFGDSRVFSHLGMFGHFQDAWS
jgi:hypothetical protein